VPLRPLGVGEILDGAISTMRAHPRPMLGLSAVVAVVTQLLTVPVTWLLLHDVGAGAFRLDQPTSEEDGVAVAAGSVTAAALQVLVTLVATLVLTGILTVVVSRAVLGQPVQTGEAWRQARPRLPALFGVTALVFLILAGTLLAALAPGFVLLAASAPTPLVVLVFVLGAAAALVAGVYLYVAFALAPAAAVLERQRVVAALRRSRRLVRGAWWRTFGILALVQLIGQMLAGILAIPFVAASFGAAFLTGGADELNPYGLLPLTVSAVGSIVGSAVTWPFTAAATVLLYVDRRIRREALDLELTRAAG
jgi:hypothetical protein